LRHGLNVNTINVPVRASIGIAFTEHSTVGHELLDSADRALLEAKAQGKGRAVLVSSLS